MCMHIYIYIYIYIYIRPGWRAGCLGRRRGDKSTLPSGTELPPADPGTEIPVPGTGMGLGQGCLPCSQPAVQGDSRSERHGRRALTASDLTSCDQQALTTLIRDRTRISSVGSSYSSGVVRRLSRPAQGLTGQTSVQRQGRANAIYLSLSLYIYIYIYILAFSLSF